MTSTEKLIQKINEKTAIIGIIGLGYVGLPLAVEFGKKFKVYGLDINCERIAELKKGIDKTLEISREELSEAKKLLFTHDQNDLRGCDFFIVTVPTPIDQYKRPNLTPLIKASEAVGNILAKDSVVIYESTVFPGCTKEECVPVLEENSGLKFNIDFYCGYSPERINPGDKEHRVSTIKKVTSGSTAEIGIVVDKLYKTIIIAGTHLVSTIEIAEAAKVIENSQRDINIAFVNELAKLFNLMNIDTIEVLEAAGTKWNFLPFRPGLVGGHCIGVDPYYLTHKATQIGYHPEIILAGRRLNDSMGSYVAQEFIKNLIQKEHKILNSKVLVLGITFKENCPDIRNSRAIDIINELKQFGCLVDVYDPWVDKEEVFREYKIEIFTKFEEVNFENYAGIILAVAHTLFTTINFAELKNKKITLYDVKGVLDKKLVDNRL